MSQKPPPMPEGQDPATATPPQANIPGTLVAVKKEPGKAPTTPKKAPVTVKKEPVAPKNGPDAPGKTTAAKKDPNKPAVTPKKPSTVKKEPGRSTKPPTPKAPTGQVRKKPTEPLKTFPSVRVDSKMLLETLIQRDNTYMDTIAEFNYESFWEVFSQTILPIRSQPKNGPYFPKRLDASFNGLLVPISGALLEGTLLEIRFDYERAATPEAEAANTKNFMTLILQDSNAIQLKVAIPDITEGEESWVSFKVDQVDQVPVCRVDTREILGPSDSSAAFKDKFVMLSFAVFFMRWLLLVLTRGRSILSCTALMEASSMETEQHPNRYALGVGSSQQQEAAFKALSAQQSNSTLDWEIFTVGANNGGYLSRFPEELTKVYVVSDYKRTGVVLVLTRTDTNNAKDVSESALNVFTEGLASLPENKALGTLVKTMADKTRRFAVGELPTVTHVEKSDVETLKELLVVDNPEEENPYPVNIGEEYFSRAKTLLQAQSNRFSEPNIEKPASSDVQSIPPGASQQSLEDQYGFRQLRLPVTQYKMKLVKKTIEAFVPEKGKDPTRGYFEYLSKQADKQTRELEKLKLELDSEFDRLSKDASKKIESLKNDPVQKRKLENKIQTELDGFEVGRRKQLEQVNAFVKTEVPASVPLTSGDFPFNSISTAAERFHASPNNLTLYSTEEEKFSRDQQRYPGKVPLTEKNADLLRDLTPMDLELCAFQLSSQYYAQLSTSLKPTPQTAEEEEPEPSANQLGNPELAEYLEEMLTEEYQGDAMQLEEAEEEEEEKQSQDTETKQESNEKAESSGLLSQDKQPFIFFKRNIRTLGDVVDFEDSVNVYVGFDPAVAKKKALFGEKTKMLYFYIGRWNTKAWISVDLPADLWVASTKTDALKLFKTLVSKQEYGYEDDDDLRFFYIHGTQYPVIKALVEKFFQLVLDPRFKIDDKVRTKPGAALQPMGAETKAKPFSVQQGRYEWYYAFADGDNPNISPINESHRYTLSGTLGDQEEQIEHVVESVHALTSIELPLKKLIENLRNPANRGQYSGTGYGRSKNMVIRELSQLAYSWSVSPASSAIANGAHIHTITVEYTFDDEPEKPSESIDQTLVKPVPFSSYDNSRPPLKLVVSFVVNPIFYGKFLQNVSVEKDAAPGALLAEAANFLDSIRVEMSGYIRMVLEHTTQKIDNNLRVSTSRDIYDVVQYLYDYFKIQLSRGSESPEISVFGRPAPAKTAPVGVSLVETVILVDLGGLELPILSNKPLQIREDRYEANLKELETKIAGIDFFQWAQQMLGAPSVPWVSSRSIGNGLSGDDKVVLVREASPFDHFFKNVVFMYVYFSQRNDYDKPLYSDPKKTQIAEMLMVGTATKEINHVASLKNVLAKCRLVAVILDGYLLVDPPRYVRRYPDIPVSVVLETPVGGAGVSQVERTTILSARQTRQSTKATDYESMIRFLTYLENRPVLPIFTRRSLYDHRFPSVILKTLFERWFNLKVIDQTEQPANASIYDLRLSFDITGDQPSVFKKNTDKNSDPEVSAKDQESLNDKYKSQLSKSGKVVVDLESPPMFLNIFEAGDEGPKNRKNWFDRDYEARKSSGRICVIPNTDLDLTIIGRARPEEKDEAKFNIASLFDLVMPASVFHKLDARYPRVLSLKAQPKGAFIGTAKRNTKSDAKKDDVRVIGMKEDTQQIVKILQVTPTLLNNFMNRTKRELEDLSKTLIKTKEAQQKQAYLRAELGSQEYTLEAIGKYAAFIVGFVSPKQPLGAYSEEGLFGSRFARFWVFCRVLNFLGLPFHFSPGNLQTGWYFSVPKVIENYMLAPGAVVLKPESFKSAIETAPLTEFLKSTSPEREVYVFRQKPESKEESKEKQKHYTLNLVKRMLETVLPFYQCIPKYRSYMFNFSSSPNAQKLDRILRQFNYPLLVKGVHALMDSLWLDGHIYLEKKIVSIRDVSTLKGPELTSLENLLRDGIIKALDLSLSKFASASSSGVVYVSDEEMSGDESDFESDSDDDELIVFTLPRTGAKRSQPEGHTQIPLKTNPAKKPKTDTPKLEAPYPEHSHPHPICKGCKLPARYYCKECGPVHSSHCHDGLCRPNHSMSPNIARIGAGFVKKVAKETGTVLRKINPLTAIDKIQQKKIKKGELK